MLIYTRHDPRFFDRRLHKGGDGGAADMRKQEEDRQAKVQAAVDAINGKFGVAPAAAAVAPTREQFAKPASAGGGQWMQTGPSGEMDGTQVWQPDAAGAGGFDEAGFAKALADFQGGQDSVAGAKTARDAMYADIAGATTDMATRDLDRQFTKASKANTFGLARSGQLGGSIDAESGGELNTLYGEGKLKAQQAGTTAAAELRGNDEKTRQNLISLAQSGLDTGTASSLAAGQMGAAADVAKGQAAGASVGQLFNNMSQAYLTNQVLRAQQTGAGMPMGSTGYGTSVFGTNKYVGTQSK